MSSLVIKGLPQDLHRKLKEQAARHHRSMTREAIALLERGLALDEEVREPPAPYKGKFPLTEALINHAKREGRE